MTIQEQIRQMAADGLLHKQDFWLSVAGHIDQLQADKAELVTVLEKASIALNACVFVMAESEDRQWCRETVAESRALLAKHKSEL